METAASLQPPPSPVPAVRPFSAGDVIGRAFSVWFGNFVPFSIVLLLVNVPVFVLVASAPAEDPSRTETAANFVSAIVNLVATGALTFGVLQTLSGAPVGLGRLLSTGFSRLGRVFLVSLGLGVIVFVGLILLVVPGIIAIAALYVAIPAVVVEDVTPGEALGRSRKLTKGSRWGILAVGLASFAVTLAAGFVVGLGVALLGGTLPHPVPGLLSTAFLALVAPLGACASAVAYHDLRVANEGVDTAALVKVFE